MRLEFLFRPHEFDLLPNNSIGVVEDHRGREMEEFRHHRLLLVSSGNTSLYTQLWERGMTLFTQSDCYLHMYCLGRWHSECRTRA